MRLKRFTLIGIVILIISLLIQLGLFVSSKTGVSKDSPVLVMYGFDEEFFPHTSFGNAVHKAGFDYILLSKDLKKSFDIEEEISLPKGYRSRNIVYMVNGESSTSALKLFDTDEDTLGYVLVNPVFETNFSMEGMSSTSPSHDVAIFNGMKDCLKDSKIIYERLSGEDTLYGIRYMSGGVFSSECYSNPIDTRYFSMAGIDYASTNLMLASPVFQIELSNYLSSNYMNQAKTNSSSIVIWYVLEVFSFFFFISGLLLTMAQLNVLKYKMKDEISKAMDTVSIVVVGIVSLLLVVIVMILANIPKAYSVLWMTLCLMPAILILVMAIIRAGYVLKNSNVRVDDKIPSWFKWLLGMAIVLFVFILSLNVYGITAFDSSVLSLLLIVLVVALDFVSVLVLASADTISRLKREGGCSYFGNLLFPLYTVVPSIVALIVCLILKIDSGVQYSIFGLLCAVVPYVSGSIIKRRTTIAIEVSAIHAILYLIILLLVA